MQPHPATLRPIAFRVGPQSGAGGAPAVEVHLEDGRVIRFPLDVAHAAAIRDRLTDVLDGSITRKPPSRRVLEISIPLIPNEEEMADTEAPPRLTLVGG